MFKPIYSALPSKERALFLRNNADVNLVKSVNEISLFLNHASDSSNNNSQLQLIIQRCGNSSKYLLNSCLIENLQNENLSVISNLLESYSSLDSILKNGLNIISYNELGLSFQEKIKSLCAIGIREKPVLNLVRKDEIEKNKKYISDALIVIKKYERELFGEIEIFFDTILLLDSKSIKAGTSVEMLGTMFLEVNYINSLMRMIEIIIHESSHMYLHFINVEDHLIINDPQDLFQSPYRKELRPMMGVFHATFVASRVVYFFKKLKNSDLCLKYEDEINSIISFNQKRFEIIYPIVKSKAKATEMGNQIISTMPILLESS